MITHTQTLRNTLVLKFLKEWVIILRNLMKADNNAGVTEGSGEGTIIVGNLGLIYPIVVENKMYTKYGNRTGQYRL